MQLVSILMPKLRRDRFNPVIEQILSDQTYQSFEFIILEEDWSISKKIPGAIYPKITSPENQPITIGAKYNIGHSIANGDIILQMNSDDYYSPNYIEKCTKLIDQNNLFFGHRFFYVYNILSREFGVVNNDTEQETEIPSLRTAAAYTEERLFNSIKVIL